MDITLSTATRNMQRLSALRAQRDAANERLDAAQAELTRLQKGRSAALLDRADVEVDAWEANIEKAQKAVARETDRIKVLDTEIAALNPDQTASALRARVDKAQAARAVGEKIVLELYPKAAKKVGDLLTTLTAIESFIQDVNESLTAAGADNVMRVPPVNAARARPDVVIDAHAVVEEVHDLERRPIRVSGGDFTGVVATEYPTKKVTRHVPKEVINFRPPYETLDGTCVLPPARDGELPYWAPQGVARRDAIANAESIVDAAIK